MHKNNIIKKPKLAITSNNGFKVIEYMLTTTHFLTEGQLRATIPQLAKIIIEKTHPWISGRCSFLNSATSISAPKSNFVIRHNFTCTSSNIIYCISSSKFCKLYIGETGRRLSDRFAEPLRSIRNNDVAKPVARHFNPAKAWFRRRSSVQFKSPHLMQRLCAGSETVRFRRWI